MKFILSGVLLLTTMAWAGSVKDFNKELIETAKTDFKKDEDTFKTRAARAPASVEVEVAPADEVPNKIDKNVRQIGPNKW
ncbi:hypothetical protein [Peredibacter starrii]|uniref:Uncharacterized protein n=1 Tax=Peredibacter starrii TaxID=28202 RepID=A0AAX4HT27_9BACT|nr:hypothetical protein [Peredibacter starrii]WPU66382.1 hypothetical protein SOO65_06455 [Peredibacter starrii]